MLKAWTHERVSDAFLSWVAGVPAQSAGGGGASSRPQEGVPRLPSCGDPSGSRCARAGPALPPGKVSKERGAPFPKEATGQSAVPAAPGEAQARSLPDPPPHPTLQAPSQPCRTVTVPPAARSPLPQADPLLTGALEVNPALGFEVKIHFFNLSPFVLCWC